MLVTYIFERRTIRRTRKHTLSRHNLLNLYLKMTYSRAVWLLSRPILRRSVTGSNYGQLMWKRNGTTAAAVRDSVDTGIHVSSLQK